MTGKATVKAVLLIQEVEDDKLMNTKGETPPPPMSGMEMFSLAWKEYVPAVGSGALTIAAIFGANHVNSRRAAGMAAAYSLSEKAFSEYKEKVIERVGEKKERGYRDELAQQRVNNNPVGDNSVIITDGGEVLCYDQFTGRYFKSSMEALKQAGNEINYLILHQGYASLSDFYHDIGLPATSISEELGWNSDQLLELEFSTVLSQDGRPCIAIDYNHHPVRNFDKYNS